MIKLLHLRYRKRLQKILGSTDIEAFFQLMWAVNIVQGKDPKSALNYLDPAHLPVQAISGGALNPYTIHKWEIETLCNEVCTTERRLILRNGGRRTLRTDSYHSALECVKQLRSIENAEYRIHKAQEDITIEMGRIAARQFDWQTGFANISHIYRNVYIYGQGRCAVEFYRKHGMSVDKFSLVGFILYAGLNSQPLAHFGKLWDRMGITEEEYNVALERLSLPEEKFVAVAKAQRSKIVHTQDKPSILRRYPCVRFGKSNERVRAPLPDLIIERITSGIFYDLASCDGQVRNEYGRRFESYCRDYLRTSLPNFAWAPESIYRYKGKNQHTPDLLMLKEKRVRLVIECKASRMSHEAAFGTNPLSARGYEDLVKAVTQIWRFKAHSRLGDTGFEIDPSALGMVLTLDNWLVMSDAIKNQVMERAREKFQNDHGEISKQDFVPIRFVTVRELERALSIANHKQFLEALEKMDEAEFSGWRFDVVMDHLFGGTGERSKYPFSGQLSTLLPWWGEISAQSGNVAPENSA